MSRVRILAFVLATSVLATQTASADTIGSASGGQPATQSNLVGCLNGTQAPSSGQQSAIRCASDGSISVTGSLSASVAPFAPNGNNATIAVTASNSSVALPSGAAVLVSNVGTANTAYVTLSVGAGTATVATGIAIPAGGSVGVAVGTNTFLNALTASSTTTLNIAGGTGIVSGFGGGAASVTIGAPLGSTTSPNGVSVTIASDQAAVAVKQATAGNLNATIVGTGTFADQATLQAGSAVVGKVGIDQTTPGTTNAVSATNFPTTVSTGTGAQGASSPRVTVATDSATVAGSAPGTATVPSVNVISTVVPDVTSFANSLALQTLNANIAATVVGRGVIAWQVVGLTGQSATLTFECTSDNATTWNAINVVTGTADVPSATITTDGRYIANAAGCNKFRLRVSTTGATTNATVSYTENVSSSMDGLTIPLPPGSNTIGAVTQASGPWTANVTQFGTNNVATGTGVSGVGIPRVTVSNDSSLAANQSVNVAQVNGITTSTGTGAQGTGAQRVTVATDSATVAGSASLPTGSNVIGALTANQSVNTAQVNGVAVSTGAGAVGTGSMRTAVGQDTTTIAGSAPGTAGTASANVVTVQGVESMTKLLVTPDSVALPANQSVNVAQVNGGTTVTSATGVQKVGVVGNAGAVFDAAGQNVASPANEILVGCQFNTSPTTITSTNMSPAQCDNAGNNLVKVNVALPAGTALIGKFGIDQTTPGTTNAVQTTNLPSTVSVGTGAQGASSPRVTVATDTATIAGSAVGTAGTASANVLTVQGVSSMTKLLVTPDSVALPANQSVNVAQINGVATTMNNGAAGTGVQRVTIASDSTGQIVLAAGSAIAGKVGIDQTTDITTNGVEIAPTAGSAAGITPLIGAASVGDVVVKASAGNFYSAYVTTGSTAGFLMVVNKATWPANGAITAGTAANNLEECVQAPANSTTSISYGSGPPEVFSTGISVGFSSAADCTSITLSATALVHGSAK